MTALTILFDIRNPQSFLALAPTIELLDELKADADWQPLLMALPKAVAKPAEHAERGEWHRWHRAQYRLADLRRYGHSRGLPDDCFTPARLFDAGEGRVAAAACLWCQAHAPDLQLSLLSSLFQRFWLDQLDLDSPTQVLEVMTAVTGQDMGFGDDIEQALSALDAQQNLLRELGCFEVPGYLIADQTYYGRQHLPMVRWHLQGEPGDPPVWGRYGQ